jgi:HAD superfamily hydrolase (TIGR01509 family)
MIGGIILDFDGLILDTEGPVYQSWIELYQEHGTNLPFEEWATIIGTSNKEHFDPFKKLEEKIGRQLDRQALIPRRYARELELCYAQPILPGVLEVIEATKEMGLKLAIASSSSRQWVRGHLTRLGLDHYFEVVHTSEDVERTKPNPALYVLTLKSLDLDPEEAIVFEDSPNGVAAAKSAGIFVVAVPNPVTRRLSLDHADLKMDSLTDLSLGEIISRADYAE